MADKDNIGPEKPEPAWQEEQVEVTSELAKEKDIVQEPSLEDKAKPERKSFSRFSVGVLLICVAFVSAFVGGAIAAFAIPAMLGVSPLTLLKEGGLKPAAIERVIYRGKSTSGSLSTDPIIAVSKKVQPSVVNIRTQSVLSDIFHQNVKQSGEGSGVIFRKDGYIITNNHVVENAKEIWVTIGADKDVKGAVVGRDAETDLAVVKVDRKDLPAAALGSVKDIEVGELAIAIGSPFGFERTVTAGIISALNRTVSFPSSETGETKTYTNLVQTDAAINPGNSGGALCDSDGRVIGINALIYSRTGGYEGIGFAIPIDTARNVARQLIEKGKATHPYIGILGTTVDKDYAKAHNLKLDYGAIIAEVLKDSPAEKAGLKKGDIIVKFNDEKVEDMEGLIVAVRDRNVGDKVTIIYVRKNEEKTIDMTLAEKPGTL